MIYSILIAGAFPLIFLYLVNRLNFFETHRPGLVLLAIVWGVVASWLSYLVSHPLVPILGRQFVSTHTAPVVEEIWKSLILIYLVRRSDHTFFVDGAIYGFAAGVGFAVSENLLYLSRVDVNTGLIVAIARAFSSSVMHGSSTALVGIIIGGFPLGRARHPLIALFIGWAVAIGYHIAYNRITFMNFGSASLFVVVGAAFTGLLLVAATILWGLRRERGRLRRTLAAESGVSKGEARLVQRVDDLDVLLAPVEQRFGKLKREQVADLLLLQARLGLKQGLMKKTRDRELRAELTEEIAVAKRELRHRRNNVGMYVMSYVRSIVSRTAWSIWARLGQSLLTLERSDRPTVWQLLERPRSPLSGSVGSIYVHVLATIEARRDH